MSTINIDESTTYVIEEERNRLYAHIWQHGTDNCNPDFLEYYRSICLELEFRDQQKPQATIHKIK